jgi:hypothetical protein
MALEFSGSSPVSVTLPIIKKDAENAVGIFVNIGPCVNDSLYWVSYFGSTVAMNEK